MSELVVICVDDEEIILNALENELAGELDECTIETAMGGAEALELIKELNADKVEIAAVVSDFIMPMMKGDELLITIHKLLPSTQTIMLTGQSQIEGVTRAINKANLYRFIEKPWDKQDLQLTLKSAVKKFQSDRVLEQQEKLIFDLGVQLKKTGSEDDTVIEDNFEKLYDQTYFRYFFHTLPEKEKNWVAEALILLTLADDAISKKEMDYIKVILKEDRREDVVSGHLEKLKNNINPVIGHLRTDRDKAFSIFKHLLLFQISKKGIKESEEKAIYQIGRLLGFELAQIGELVNIMKKRIVCDFQEYKILGKLKEMPANYLKS
jgi:YesN/AraC family two-component response regulator